MTVKVSSIGLKGLEGYRVQVEEISVPVTTRVLSRFVEFESPSWAGCPFYGTTTVLLSPHDICRRLIGKYN